MAEIARFAWRQKRWWLVPVIAVCLIITSMLLLSTSPASPFLYTLF